MKRQLISASFVIATSLGLFSACTDHDVAGVTVPATNCSRATTTVERVVCLAEAFKATLSADQVATLQLAYTKELAIRWSNLPCGISCRNGLQLSSLTDVQREAALAVIQAAAGTTENEGSSEIQQIRAADDYLNSIQGTSTNPGSGTMTGPGSSTMTGPGSGTMTGPGSGTMTGPGSNTMTNPGTGTSGAGGYSSGIYFIAFLGSPSTTGTWQLQFGGHHLAHNYTYKANTVVGATPLFEGVEPTSFTYNGATYAPLNQEHAAMVAMLASLTQSQLTTAKLSTTFSDVVLGPNADGQFPATKVGLPVSSLNDSQKALVLAAIRPWVLDADDATAATLLATYQNELSGTYVAYSNNPALTSNTDYVRIDGPSVWIEFVCQSGVVVQNQIHYHSVWRDHTRDYGGNFVF